MYSELHVQLHIQYCSAHKASDVSSPQQQTADRDHSQRERESGGETANQSRVNSPAGQWEPGGEDVSLMLNPPPPIESCLEGQGGGVTGRGEGGEGAGRAGPREASLGKDLISSRRDNSC